LLETYFKAKRIGDAHSALLQLRALVEVGDGHEVDRSHVMLDHMKWLEDPTHDLWLVPDGSTAQYFDLRKNDERFTGYGVLALEKEAQTGMHSPGPHLGVTLTVTSQFGKLFTHPLGTCLL